MSEEVYAFRASLHDLIGRARWDVKTSVIMATLIATAEGLRQEYLRCGGKG